MSERELKKTINQQGKKIAELNVLVDTLQTALRTSEKYLKDHPDYDRIFSTSARWALNHKINNE